MFFVKVPEACLGHRCSRPLGSPFCLPLCAAQSAANMSIVGMVCGTENISIGAGSHNTREQLGSEDSLSILPDEEHGGLG